MLSNIRADVYVIINASWEKGIIKPQKTWTKNHRPANLCGTDIISHPPQKESVWLDIMPHQRGRAHAKHFANARAPQSSPTSCGDCAKIRFSAFALRLLLCRYPQVHSFRAEACLGRQSCSFSPLIWRRVQQLRLSPPRLPTTLLAAPPPAAAASWWLHAPALTRPPLPCVCARALGIAGPHPPPPLRCFPGGRHRFFSEKRQHRALLLRLLVHLLIPPALLLLKQLGVGSCWCARRGRGARGAVTQ